MAWAPAPERMTKSRGPNSWRLGPGGPLDFYLHILQMYPILPPYRIAWPHRHGWRVVQVNIFVLYLSWFPKHWWQTFDSHDIENKLLIHIDENLFKVEQGIRWSLFKQLLPCKTLYDVSFKAIWTWWDIFHWRTNEQECKILNSPSNEIDNGISTLSS